MNFNMEKIIYFSEGEDVEHLIHFTVIFEAITKKFHHFKGLIKIRFYVKIRWNATF